MPQVLFFDNKTQSLCGVVLIDTVCTEEEFNLSVHIFAYAGKCLIVEGNGFNSFYSFGKTCKIAVNRIYKLSVRPRAAMNRHEAL